MAKQQNTPSVSDTWAEILGAFEFRKINSEILKSGVDLQTWQNDLLDPPLRVWVGPEDGTAIIDTANLDYSIHKAEWSKYDVVRALKFAGNFKQTQEFLDSGRPVVESPFSKIGRIYANKRNEEQAAIEPGLLYELSDTFASRVDSKMLENAATEVARQKAIELQYLREGVAPPADDLEALLSEPEEPEDYLVDKLLPRECTASIVAAAKTGKTTLLANLVQSLADSEPFLGVFPVDDVKGQIGFINFELTREQSKKWFSRMGIKNITNRVKIWNLRGKPNPLISQISRERFAGEVRSYGIKVLIVDPFSSAARGRDTLNNDQVKEFLLDLEEFKELAEVPCLIFAVHAGRDPNKTRGASTLDDHPDVLIYLTKDDYETRYMHAIGRDVEIPQGSLHFDPTNGKLHFKGDSRSAAKVSRIEAAILDYVEANPDAKASEIDNQVAGRNADKPTARQGLVDKGLLECKNGPGGAKLYKRTSSPLPTLPLGGPASPVVRSTTSPLYIGGGVTTTDDAPAEESICSTCGIGLCDDWQMEGFQDLYLCFQCDSVTEVFVKK